jgi:hypothetical protein
MVNAVKSQTKQLMKTKTILLGLSTVVATAVHAAISITSGNFDTGATMEGAVLFRALNTSPSQQEVYLATTPAALGTSDRSQTDLVWNSGATFSFGWDPTRHKIFTEVVTTASGTKRLERNFSTPEDEDLPNFILISGKDSTPLNNLVLRLTGLDGNAYPTADHSIAVSIGSPATQTGRARIHDVWARNEESLGRCSVLMASPSFISSGILPQNCAVC